MKVKATPKSEHLEQLLEISTLLTSSLELNSVLTLVLQAAAKLMDVEASNVMLLDRAKGDLVYEVVLGNASDKIKEEKRLKVGVGIAGWVAQNGQPLLIDDAYKDSRFFPDFDKKTGFRTKSIFCIPLRAGGNMIGIAQVINKKDGSVFSEEDQFLFSKFGEIAAVAIDKALLHRQILDQDRLKRDMQLAAEIQKTFVPEQTPEIPQLRIEFRSVACRHVGGDVMEISRLPDGKLAVLIGDVSGKGVPAALFGTRFSCEYSYERKTSSEGGSLFERLNHLVATESTRGMFITAIYSVIDPVTGVIQMVNAGHPAPLIVGPGPGEFRWAETAEYPPLGIVDGLTYSSTELRLKPGERIVWITDGVPDARSGSPSTGSTTAATEQFGTEAAKTALMSCPGNALGRLMKELKGFTQEASLADDITVISVGYGSYEELTFTSHSSDLSQARKFVEDRAVLAGFGEKIQGRIALAVTEAVSNVIRHTYKEDPNQKIRIGVGVTDTEFRIYLRDWGPKQDFRTFVSRKLEEIRPGGLGIHYIKQVMDMVEFDDSHREGNELYLMMKKG